MTTALILGAAVWRDGPSPTLRSRTLHAAALYHAGIATHLIPCGGLGLHPPTEAQAMRALLIAQGVPDTALTLEERSTTTGENIRFAAALILERDVLIVTDWYHAPRARLAARRAGLTAKTSAPPRQGGNPQQQIKSALREVFAYIVYFLDKRR